MAQVFARLGSEVTLIERAPQLLPGADPDAAACVARRMAEDGVALRLGAAIAGVAAGADGVRLHLATGDVLCDRLLVAAGRVPNVEELDLAAAGVRFTDAGVLVDDHLRTSNRRIFAAGDVCSAFKSTHAADALARIVIQNALFFGRKRVSALVIPSCTYTDPEVAHVGCHADAAREGGRVETITVPLEDTDRGVVDDERNGFVRVHHERGRLLGCTVVASRAGEMIGVATDALRRGASLADLGATIHPYPTLNNAFRAAGDAYARRRLTPRVRRLLARYFRLVRG
jgi:pyruvate/2-oxoglutarate dehydrogenase complex dihydrolipoamide dehydrogenase (E3) component